MVEHDLFRSGQPNELNFPFLEKLQLKTVIWLAPEEPSEALYVVVVVDFFFVLRFVVLLCTRSMLGATAKISWTITTSRRFIWVCRIIIRTPGIPLVKTWLDVLFLHKAKHPQ